MVAWAFVGGYQKEPIVNLSRKLLRPHDHVLDIGANVGLWSISAAQRVSRVTAFEPNPGTAARLERNSRASGVKVEIQRVALSDRIGTSLFFDASHGNSGAAGLARREGVTSEIRVRTTTVDSYLEGGTVDVIKLDVEGAEPLVLAGAQRTLGGPHPPIVFCEINDPALETLAFNRDTVLGMFDDVGLEVVPLDDETSSGDVFDVVAFPPDERERVANAMSGMIDKGTRGRTRPRRARVPCE